MLEGQALRDAIAKEPDADKFNAASTRPECDLCDNQATGCLTHMTEHGPCSHPICDDPQCRLVALLGIMGLI